MNGENASILESQDRVAKKIVLPEVIERLHRLRAHTSGTVLGDQSLSVRFAQVGISAVVV